MNKGMKLGALGMIALLVGCVPGDMDNILTRGDTIQTSAERHAPTKPNKVALYFSHMPRSYRSIGFISVKNNNAMGVPRPTKSVLEDVRSRAADLGADAVINIKSNLLETTGEAVLFQ